MTDTYIGMTPDEAFDNLVSAQNAYHTALMSAMSPDKTSKGKKLRAQPKTQSKKKDEPITAGNPETDAGYQHQADAPGQEGKGNGFDPSLLVVTFQEMLQAAKGYIEEHNAADQVKALLSDKYSAKRLSEVPENKRHEFLAELGLREMA